MANLRQQEAVFDALLLIKKNGGQMRSGDIFTELGKSFPQSSYETEQTKSGNQRWENWLAFYSIDAVKSGFIMKDKGVWHITNEGENALNLSLEDFAKALKRGYDNWYNSHNNIQEEEKSNEIDSIIEIDVIQAQAANGIRDYIASKNPYEFQNLAAALLRALGYYTPFIAPKGKDGGVDIVAYHDPLGTSLPRVKVQVKHYPSNTISVDIVRNLLGVLAKDGEVGIVITSGTFTNDAKREARNSHTPLRLIDINEFTDLWIKYYSTMQEEDKSLLPIIPIYFVKPDNR